MRGSGSSFLVCGDYGYRGGLLPILCVILASFFRLFFLVLDHDLFKSFREDYSAECMCVGVEKGEAERGGWVWRGVVSGLGHLEGTDWLISLVVVLFWSVWLR